MNSNPFSTSRVKPGRLPFFFPPDQKHSTLVRQLEEFRWQAQIVGPHGSGKSTLVKSLVQCFSKSGRNVDSVTFHSGGLFFSKFFRQRRHWDANTQLVVDGFEQLHWVQRCLLRRACVRRSCGLLVTAHVSVGLPTLYQTSADLCTARRIVRFLMAAENCITEDDVSNCFRGFAPNVREVLFALYDLYEHRSR